MINLFTLNSELFTIIGVILYIIIIVGVIIKIVKDTENPTKALGYVLVVVVVPVIGIILYFSVGVNYRLEKLYNRKSIADKIFYKELKNIINIFSEKRIQENNELLKDKIHPVKMLLKDSTSPLFNVKNVKLLINGENKFKYVIAELKKAKKHIHIEYYIFSDDTIGNQIKDILIRKVKEGIKVRFIYDDFGSHELNKRMVKELKNAGVEVAAFYKIKLYALANRLNYRNHRKIIVIDSHIGFVGGINVNDKYINDSSDKLYWRDTHIMIEGEAVNGLQYVFLNDWNFCSENKIAIEESKYFKVDDKIEDIKIKSNKLVQIAASGPDSDRATIMLVYSGIIMSSKEKLYLTTPYLIPNETIVNALKYVALSGVDVRILVPYESDSIFVNLAASSYYEELMNTGVRIYRYKKGFIHAKTIISDDTLSVIGSTNLDMRSFDLNFEISALVFSKEINTELCSSFMEDINNSSEIDLKEWQNRSKLKQISESFAKLISPLL